MNAGLHRYSEDYKPEEVQELGETQILPTAPEALPVAETEPTVKTPVPTATGNERIAVAKHELSIVPMWARDEEIEYGKPPTPDGVELAIRNVSSSTIATAVFEAVFYDQAGNTLDTVKHTEVELPPETSRGIRITCTLLEHDLIQSYAVRLLRATTADAEKVQLRMHEMNTTETGEEEIAGVVKNLSGVKTDAAVVATFYDSKKENIGTRIVVVRDIEPHSVKKYTLKFKPLEGDIVRTYTLNIGELVD